MSQRLIAAVQKFDELERAYDAGISGTGDAVAAAWEEVRAALAAALVQPDEDAAAIRRAADESAKAEYMHGWRAGMEDAAKACDLYAEMRYGNQSAYDAIKACVAKIRALAAPGDECAPAQPEDWAFDALKRARDSIRNSAQPEARCECGHPMQQHAFRKDRCLYHPCGCRSFRPAEPGGEIER